MDSTNCLIILLLCIINVYSSLAQAELPVPDNATIARANVDVMDAKSEVARLRARATIVENAEMVVSNLLNEIKDLDPEIVKDLLRLGVISKELPAKVAVLEQIMNSSTVLSTQSSATPVPTTTTRLPVTTESVAVTTQPPVDTTQPATEPPIATTLTDSPTTESGCICFAALLSTEEISYAQTLVNESRVEIHRIRALASDIEKSEIEVSKMINEINYLDPDIVTDLKRLIVIANELPAILKKCEELLIKAHTNQM